MHTYCAKPLAMQASVVRCRRTLPIRRAVGKEKWRPLLAGAEVPALWHAGGSVSVRMAQAVQRGTERVASGTGMGSVSKYKREVLVAPAPGAVRMERKNFVALEAPVAPETPYRQDVANKFHHVSSLLSGGRLWRSELRRPPA